MTALDARRIQKARVIANQAATREDQLRERLQPSRRDGSRAIADALTALKEGADRGMGFVTLKFFVGGKIRIAVIQSHNEADGDQVVRKVVKIRATVGVRRKRPTGGMHDQTR